MTFGNLNSRNVNEKINQNSLQTFVVPTSKEHETVLNNQRIQLIHRSNRLKKMNTTFDQWVSTLEDIEKNQKGNFNDAQKAEIFTLMNEDKDNRGFLSWSSVDRYGEINITDRINESKFLSVEQKTNHYSYSKTKEDTFPPHQQKENLARMYGFDSRKLDPNYKLFYDSVDLKRRNYFDLYDDGYASNTMVGDLTFTKWDIPPIPEIVPYKAKKQKKQTIVNPVIKEKKEIEKDISTELSEIENDVQENKINHLIGQIEKSNKTDEFGKIIYFIEGKIVDRDKYDAVFTKKFIDGYKKYVSDNKLHASKDGYLQYFDEKFE